MSTEVCNSEEVPEVEIVSLLQEHIPKYRLRADSLTQFGGIILFPYNIILYCQLFIYHIIVKNKKYQERNKKEKNKKSYL